MGKNIVKTLGALFLTGVIALVSAGCETIAGDILHNEDVWWRGTDGKVYTASLKELREKQGMRDWYEKTSGHYYAGPVTGN